MKITIYMPELNLLTLKARFQKGLQMTMLIRGKISIMKELSLIISWRHPDVRYINKPANREKTSLNVL